MRGIADRLSGASAEIFAGAIVSHFPVRPGLFGKQADNESRVQ
jgi:hypothetical protein